MECKTVSKVYDFLVRIKLIYFLALTTAIGFLLFLVIFGKDFGDYRQDVLHILKPFETIGEQPEKEE